MEISNFKDMYLAEQAMQALIRETRKMPGILEGDDLRDAGQEERPGKAALVRFVQLRNARRSVVRMV